jgi:enamine deaminase RidA (YjgF/YER057c/UK114 family)
MSINRTIPDIGYLNPSLLKGAGVSQIVRTGNTVYMSGIVAAVGEGQCVAPKDFPRQINFVIETLGKCLKSEGLTWRHVADVTVYTTDIKALRDNAQLLANAFRDHPPTMTWIEVTSLTEPDYMLELKATAAAD